MTSEESDLPARVAADLAKAIREKDANALESARDLQRAAGLPRDRHLEEQLLLEDWHREHEDMIRALQDEQDPRSVPILREAIRLKPRLEYLDYDDYGAYYKKCLWALQSIGTPEAVDLIRECAESEIPELKEQARYRLGRMGL